MEYRRLGRSGVKVSEVSVGGWLTHGRTLSDDTTQGIIEKAFELGVNFFDTADVYHTGQAELSLGKAVKGIRRADLVIATKCFFPMSEKPNDSGLSRKHIVESVNDSLKRLDMDYIDLFQFHRFDPNTPLDEIAHAITDVVRQGKVHYWGVSEWPAHQIAALQGVCKELLVPGISSNQPCYNMMARGVEDAVMPICEHHGIGLVVFSPLSQGILSGKYLPGQQAPAGSRGSDDSSNMWMRGQLGDATLLERIQKLKDYAKSLDVTLAQFALAWCLRKPIVSSVITGASSIEQLTENVSASGVQITAEQFEHGEKILAGDA